MVHRRASGCKPWTFRVTKADALRGKQEDTEQWHLPRAGREPRVRGEFLCLNDLSPGQSVSQRRCSGDLPVQIFTPIPAMPLSGALPVRNSSLGPHARNGRAQRCDSLSEVTVADLHLFSALFCKGSYLPTFILQLSDCLSIRRLNRMGCIIITCSS